MSEKTEDLGRRAVACKHWRWMPGMLDTLERRILYILDGYVDFAHVGEDEEMEVRPLVYIDELGEPDLTDPATLGCLLALVREAWGTNAHTVRMHTGWWCRCVPGEPDMSGPSRPTEAEALVAALERAP